jgi:hypothetical protein
MPRRRQETVNPNAALDAAIAKMTASHGNIRDTLLDQADSILDRAIAALRGGKLSDRDAALAVAMISEIRSAADKAHRNTVKGLEAGESLIKSGASA